MKRRMAISRKNLLIGAAIIALVIIGVSLFTMKGPAISTTTTTVPAISMNAIINCRIINASGSYHLASGISTNIQSGACIDITASNVNLTCGSYGITGSGPYVDVPPFTYGIEVNGRSNVSVSGCTIRNFSYGIFAPSSSNLRISDSNLTTNYISNIYMNGTRNSSVHGNRLSGAASMQGSLYMGNGSAGNRIYNNTILRNQYYGMYVNSSGNEFLNNSINATPVSFYCVGGNGFKSSNMANSNICYNNTGCSFVQCRGINTPANFSQLELSSPVNGCGAITKPGVYTMASDVNMGLIVNVSSALLYGIPCITIKSSDVELDCNGHSVRNSTLGIVVSGATNVTLNGCNVSDSSTGITLDGTTESNVYNSTLQNDSTGMMFKNSGGDFVSNTKVYAGTYGAYLLNSYSDTFQDFNFSGNMYGAYLDNSIGEIFNRGALLGNSKLDAYATPDSANVGYSIMQLTACGYSNAQWAACKQHVSPSLLYTPIGTCGVISKSGNYSLDGNVVNAQSRCITISANNVTFSCASHSITAAHGSDYGIYVDRERNVTVNGCSLFNFALSSIGVYNSLEVRVSGAATDGGEYGVLMSNVSDSTVINTVVVGAANASIYLNRVDHSNIIADDVSYGVSKNIGILLFNSIRNNILNNMMVKNYIGMYLNGSSQNNTISNNTAEISASYDYICNGNSNIDSEQGGIN